MDREKIVEDAEQRFSEMLGIDGDVRGELRWHEWPQTWSDTTLGGGGFGGQTLTTAQTVAIEVMGMWVVYIGGQFRYAIERPSGEFFEDLHNFDLKGRATKKYLRGGEDEQ